MNMHLVDWAIVICMLMGLSLAAYATKRLSKSVADFLAANRCAGRYLLGVAEGLTGFGAIGIVAYFEMYYKAGFVPVWWTLIGMPITLFITITGWIIYRFRQTRALTLAQFFEVRYSKRFRIFAGLISFTSGVINFGIFPAVGARFFIYFCGFAETFNVFGVEVSTFAAVMLVLLLIAITFIFIGGQVTLIVTDFFQGLFSNVVLAIVLIAVVLMFDWSKVIESLMSAPSSSSMLHPMHTQDVKDFNVWFFMIGAFAAFYNWMGWQANQGFNSSAKSAHEAKMAKVLQTWRGLTISTVILLLPVCVYMVMHHPSYSGLASKVQGVLNTIQNKSIQEQMTVPVALAYMLPKGLVGALCAVILAAFISNTNTYMHSWGSIFIQDVILPFRKKPFTTEQHLWLLRAAILGVAAFAYCFGLLFKQTSYIMMFFAITAAIWLGGSGSVIIGGLYWKRGSTAAAYSALITGSVLAVAGIVIEQVWPRYHDSAVFPINSQYTFFIAIVSSILVYVIVSLLGKRVDFDMDKMLHRGKYAVETENADLRSTRGINALKLGNAGTRGDRFIYGALLVWTLGWTAVFIIGTIYNMVYDVKVESWAAWWKFYIWLSFVCGIAVTVWFAIGGIRDMKNMFHTLLTVKRDAADDGSVIGQRETDRPSEAQPQKAEASK